MFEKKGFIADALIEVDGGNWILVGGAILNFVGVLGPTLFRLDFLVGSSGDKSH